MLRKEQEWEACCTRCGACCGAFEDPCVHLGTDAQGNRFCRIYAERLGPQHSIGGRHFVCVPIRRVLHSRWKNDRL
ncbi:MAG: hypothetical protein PHT59_05030, partial [Candidatus Omnitrophica bacterium]|nr:hypothetical protein [Candidatus Omnitrophota bacterium]